MTDFTIKQYSLERTGVFIELWCTCFSEDAPEYVERFLNHLPHDTIILVGETEKKPVTMLFLLPATADFRDRSYAVRYLYAGCTHPKYRGRGYYRQLMAFAAKTVHRIGECGIFLHPADERLTKMYERLGYIRGIDGGGTQPSFDNFQRISVSAYYAKRQSAVFDTQSTAVVWKLNKATTHFFFEEAIKFDSQIYANGTTVALVADGKILERFPRTAIIKNSAFCLWLPTNETDLLTYMQNFGGITGNIGD